MVKKAAFIVYLIISQSLFAQNKTFSESEKATLDSMFNEDEFFKMLKDALKPKSYFQINAGIGNSYFSIKNNRLNASQQENKMVFTPAADYFHKSGLALSVAGSLTTFNRITDFYQFSVTPSYNILNKKKYLAAVSYTRYLRNGKFGDAASPIQNDLFASGYLKKPWLAPGISLGYSSGKHTAYKHIDTVFLSIPRKFTDTIKSVVRNFSANIFVQHAFEYLGIFHKKDGISIEPKLLLNAGINTYSEEHFNPYKAFYDRVIERRKNLGLLQETTPFQIQSIALSMDINYVTGNFGFEPRVYMDYYLPETSDRKFTTILSFVISYVF